MNTTYRVILVLILMLIAAIVAIPLLMNGGVPQGNETTDAPATDTAITDAATTDVVITSSTSTQPTDTAPHVTEPPATQPPDTKPPVTEPPATQPTETVTSPQTEAPDTETAYVKDPEKKYVAFTFDDGPSATYTAKFVDKLKEYGGVGTFFVCSYMFNEESTKGVKYAFDNGCEIGIHCATHTINYANCSDEEFYNETEPVGELIYSVTGKYPTLMRPVGGNISKERISASKYSIILWNVDPEDWRYKKSSDEETEQKNIQTIVDNVLNNVGDGDIVLMHEIYGNSYKAFCRIIEELDSRGYEFVTVSQLIGNPQPGTRYRYAP